MAAIAEAFVLVKPQTEGFQNQLKTQLNTVTNKASANVPIKADTKGLAPKLGSEFKRIAGIGTAIFAGVFAFKGAFDFLKGAIDKSKQAEESQLKLNTAFQTFPKLANISRESLLGLNSQLSLKTKFDKDTLASGQAVLAQFNLTGQQIREVTSLLADYAAKTGQDIPSAATALGKSFLGTTRALKTVGINYKSTGNASKDFTNITELLREKVGGFAEKEGASFSGRVEIMKNQLGELQKTIGAAVLPIFAKIADFLVSRVFPALKQVGGFLVGVFRPAFDLVREAASKFFSAFSVVAETVFKKFATSSQLLSAALKDVGPAFIAIGAAFVASKILNELQQFGTAVNVLRKAASSAGGGMGLLKAGLNTVLGALTPVNLAIGGVAALTFLLVKRNIDARARTKEFADALEQEAQGAKNATNQLILNRLEQDGILKLLNKSGISVQTFIEGIKGSKEAFDSVVASIDNLGTSSATVVTPVAGLTGSFVVADKTSTGLLTSLQDLRQEYNDGGKAAALRGQAEKALSEETKGATASTNAATESSNRFTRAVAIENKEVNTLQGHFTKISGVVDHFKNSLDATLGALLNIQDSTAKYDQDLAALGTSLKENGKSFDLNTEKGRNNSQALRTVVGDIEDQIGALVKGGKIQATDTAQKDALLGRLRALEQRFPAVKGQVTAYIDEIKKTPVTRSTSFIAKADTKSADKAAANLINHFDTRFNKEGGSVPVTVKPSFTTPSLTVTATNVTVSGASVVKKALGGFLRPGEIALTGEQGPELQVGGPQGTTIIPNNKLGAIPRGLTAQDIDRIIAAIEKAIQLSRPINVTEVAQSPVATAEAVAARLGLAGVR